MSAAGEGKDAAQAVEGAGMVDNEGGGHACKSCPVFGGGREAGGGGGQCSHWRLEFEYAEWDAVEEERRYEATLTLFSWCTSGSRWVVLNRAHLGFLGFLGLDLLCLILKILQMWTKAGGLDTCVHFAAYIQIFWTLCLNLPIKVSHICICTCLNFASTCNSWWDQLGEGSKLALTMARTQKISDQST